MNKADHRIDSLENLKLMREREKNRIREGNMKLGVRIALVNEIDPRKHVSEEIEDYKRKRKLRQEEHLSKAPKVRRPLGITQRSVRANSPRTLSSGYTNWRDSRTWTLR